jgi:hypothetical protein
MRCPDALLKYRILVSFMQFSPFPFPFFPRTNTSSTLRSQISHSILGRCSSSHVSRPKKKKFAVLTSSAIFVAYLVFILWKRKFPRCLRGQHLLSVSMQGHVLLSATSFLVLCTALPVTVLCRQSCCRLDTALRLSLSALPLTRLRSRQCCFSSNVRNKFSVNISRYWVAFSQSILIETRCHTFPLITKDAILRYNNAHALKYGYCVGREI